LERVPRLIAGLCLGWTLLACGYLVAADPHHGIPQVRFINEQVAAGWTDAGLQPAAPATEEEWCRRVYIDLVGRIPSVDELDAHLAGSSETRRVDLVNHLLGEEMVDEYARNWTDIWTTVLIGRDTENERVNRSGMRQWLRRVLAKNIPYDDFVTELVTATGVNKSGQKGFNGATNFLSGKLDENGVQATAKTAQVFLGMQVQCTQCHNHPFNKGKQNQFWEFNAFFRQARALRRYGDTRDIQAMELIDEDFAGEGSGGNAEEAELFYELRNGQMKVAFPVFVDGTAISKSGYLPGAMEDGTAYGVNRRGELAKLIVTSPLMPKALVNRIWGHFFGFGFTRPIDDLGEHNPPSHPELLDGLAERFRRDPTDCRVGPRRAMPRTTRSSVSSPGSHASISARCVPKSSISRCSPPPRPIGWGGTATALPSAAKRPRGARTNGCRSSSSPSAPTRGTRPPRSTDRFPRC
jgi:hypothetical protein